MIYLENFSELNAKREERKVSIRKTSLHYDVFFQR